MADLTRRELVRRAALLTCLPSSAALVPACARRIDPVSELSVPPPIDGALLVPVAQAKALQHAGGAVLVRSPGIAGAYLVVNGGAGYFALSGICPHAGCELTWVPEDREAECPCHGSRFAGDGTVLHPPAVVDLRRYPVEPPDSSGNLSVRLYAGDGVFKERVQNGEVKLLLAGYPSLRAVGGSVQGRPDGFPTPLVLARVAQSGPDALVALSALCTHLQCTVLPQACASSPRCASGTLLQCPCHGSQFELNGSYISGPAGGNLLRYRASFDEVTEQVTISTQFSG